MPNSKVVVKKVKAFPFPAQFKTATATFAGQIAKLTVQGFLVEVPVTTLQPLEKMECSFVLPVMNTSVTEQVVVVKIYNQWAGGVPATASGPGVTGQPAPAAAAATPSASVAPTDGSRVIHLVEMHFVSVSKQGHDTILKFLQAAQKHGL